MASKKIITSKKENKKPSSKKKYTAKEDILLSDIQDKFSYHSELQLKKLDFIDLLNLVCHNRETLNQMAMSEARNILAKEKNPNYDAPISELNIVSEELCKSLDKVYKIFPTIQQYAIDREKFFNINQSYKA